MPAVVQQSKLLAKLGGRLVNAHNESKDAAYQAPRGGDLPPIENGIATLVDCRFSVYKEGDYKSQPFFIAAGAVVSPKTVDVDGVAFPVEGLRTQIGPEPLCDSKKGKVGAKTEVPFSTHWANVTNWLKGLGLDVSQIVGLGATDEIRAASIEAQIVAGMNELVKQGVTFRFRTWKGKATKEYPDPRVNHVWGQAVEMTAEQLTDGNVVDDATPAAPVPAAAPARRTGPGPKPAAKAPEPVADSEPDMDALAIAAGDDTDAAASEAANIELTEIATAVNVDPNDYDSWAAVVEAIRAAQGGGDAGADAGTTEEDPFRVGQCVRYKPVTVDPKNKAKRIVAKKAVECNVIARDEVNGTVNLQSLENSKVKYNGVSTDALEAD